MNPGRLGFRVVGQINEEYNSERDFKPCVRSHTVQMIRSFGKDANKFKSIIRELLTLSRSMDHLITFLVRWEAENHSTDVKPSNVVADIWRALDVQAQRWGALEYVLTKQIEEPDVSVAKLWDALKYFELEPQTGSAAASGTMFDASVKASRREGLMFEKVKK